MRKIKTLVFLEASLGNRANVVFFTGLIFRSTFFGSYFPAYLTVLLLPD